MVEGDERTETDRIETDTLEGGRYNSSESESRRSQPTEWKLDSDTFGLEAADKTGGSIEPYKFRLRILWMTL